MRHRKTVAFLVALFTIHLSTITLGEEVGTAFTFQGELLHFGSPAAGFCRVNFELYDSPDWPNCCQVGPRITKDITPVNGRFTVELDFGDVFGGGARWLQIETCCRPNPGDLCVFDTLVPRQRVTAAPQAIRSAGVVAVAVATVEAGTLAIGTLSPDTTKKLHVVGDSMFTGTVELTPSGASTNKMEMDVQDDPMTGSAKFAIRFLDAGGIARTQMELLEGNAMFNGDATISGTLNLAEAMCTDQPALDIEVPCLSRIMRYVGFQFNSSTLGGNNIIGGNQLNVANDGALLIGATIAGGGATTPGPVDLPNAVFDDFGTVGGGAGNTAGLQDGSSLTSTFATVSGGKANTASGIESVVGGGWNNTASSTVSTVSGGVSNTATFASTSIGGGNSNTAAAVGATVSGGQFNTANGFNTSIGGGSGNTAGGTSSTVPGGESNSAAGNYSFAAGRQASASHNGSFVWADSTGTPFGSTATDQFLIRAIGGVGIGTTLPNSGLHVNGDSTRPPMRVQISGSSRLTVASNGGTSVGTFQDVPPPRGLYVFGDVGIGTASPAGKLHVVGAGSDSTVILPNNAISASEILDEPGASTSTNQTEINLTSTVVNLTSRQITAPTAGWVLAIGTCLARPAEVSPTEFGTLVNADFQLSTASAIQQGPLWEVQLRLFGTGRKEIPVTIHRLIPVSAGVTTIYFVAQQDAGDFRVDETQLSVVFFPTSYASVALATSNREDTGGSPEMNLPDDQAALANPVPLSAPITTPKLDSANEIALELADLRTRMNARIASLEQQLQEISAISKGGE